MVLQCKHGLLIYAVSNWLKVMIEGKWYFLNVFKCIKSISMFNSHYLILIYVVSKRIDLFADDLIRDSITRNTSSVGSTNHSLWFAVLIVLITFPYPILFTTERLSRLRCLLCLLYAFISNLHTFRVGKTSISHVTR